MKIRKIWIALPAGLLALSPLLPMNAQAGRGSSPAAIKRAISSGSVDAIEAELERAEHLVCASCVDDIRPLIDNGNEKVRKVAAWWLARRGVRKAIATEMQTRLGGSDSTLARNAADVLGEFRQTSAISSLTTALKNGGLSAEARAHCAAAIGKIGHLNGETALIEAAGNADATVASAGLTGLRSLRGFSHPAAILSALSSSDANVRSEAVYVLGHVKMAVGVTELMNLVATDPSADVRKRAAWALGEMGSGAAAASQTLSTAATSDASPLVRSIAQVALAKLSH